MLAVHTKSRGSTLFMVIILVGITAVAMVGLMSYVYGLHRISERALALERSEQTAEAGLHQLLQYFYQSSDIPSNCAANKTLIDNFLNSGMDPAAINASGMTFINASTSLNTNLISLNNAKVTLLQVTAPRTGAATGTVFSFKSVAVANTIRGERIQRTAEMDVKWNTGPALSLPAAIISGATVSGNGQFNLAWGQAWVRGAVTLLGNKGNYKGADTYGWDVTGDNNQNTDQWTKYMSATSTVNDKFNTALINNSGVYDVGAHQGGGTGTKYPGQLYQYQDSDPAFFAQYGATLSQKIDTIINSFDITGDATTGYTRWKNVAIAKGTYFKPTATGVYNGANQKLYISGGVLNTTGAGSALTVGSAMDYYRTLSNPTIVFFDTTDGNAPNGIPAGTSGSNWANISFTGSIATKSSGLFYVAGKLDIGGSGTPPGMNITSPRVPGSDPATYVTQSANVFHSGTIFTHGNFSYGGNPVIYGSIVCRGTFDCGGTPNIYYNVNNGLGGETPLSTRGQPLATVIHN